MARTLMTDSGVRQVQRRTVAVLSTAQVFAGVGTGATVSIGSILAVELSGSSAWAGAVATVMTLGAALTALPLPRWLTVGDAGPARSWGYLPPCSALS